MTDEQYEVGELVEDLDVLIGVVAGAVLDMDAPASKPLADLVASRPGPDPTIREIERIHEHERARRAREREAKLRAEEEEAGTTLRCKDCDALRPDFAEWLGGSRKDAAPTCPECGSAEEPKPRDV